MKLVYLGTSGAMPTIKRGLSSTVLVLDKEYIMVDCGDGTCRQYLKSDLKWNKPLTILITHMHSDHTMGLLGLLQSMDLMGRTERVDIIGVKGIKDFTESVNRAVNFKLGYDVEITEAFPEETIVNRNNAFTIKTCKSKHQVSSLAYRIELPDKEGALDATEAFRLGVPKNSPLLGKLKRGEDVVVGIPNSLNGRVVKSKDVVGEPTKGLVICFSGDTRPTSELGEFYKDADYVIHEATFLEDEVALAINTKHSTAYEAAFITRRAGVKHLILNHFSARYATTKGFYEEAVKAHPNVTCAEDLKEIELK